MKLFEMGFVSVSTGNYNLAAGSQAIGAAWALPADIAAEFPVLYVYVPNKSSKPRTSTNDLGAYED